MIQQSFGFRKEEHLKSRKQIDLLFRNRQSLGAYPLRLFWAETSEPLSIPVQVGFSVSKRTFKQAVKRNRHKRLMREVYRLNKHDLHDFLISNDKKINLMLLYVGKESGNYQRIEKKFLQLIDKLKKELL